MRISRTNPMSIHVNVYLNDERLTTCLVADDEVGEVLVFYEVDGRAMPTIALGQPWPDGVEDHDGMACIWRFGKVRIEFDAPEHYQEALAWELEYGDGLRG